MSQSNRSQSRIVLAAFCSAIFSAVAYGGTWTPGVIVPPEGFFGSSSRVINFDETPDGQKISEDTYISSQYSAWGIIFNEGKQDRELPSATGDHRWADAVSQPNSLIIGLPNIVYPIIVDFQDAAFSLLPNAVGLVFTDSAPNIPFTVQAFDVSEKLVDTATTNTATNTSYVPLPGDDEDTFIGLQSPAGISRIQMITEKPSDIIFGFEIDDLQFNGTLGRPGDFDGDGTLAEADITLLSQAVRAGTDSRFDVNRDRKLDFEDQRYWVDGLRKTYFGDANFDGEFSSADFVHVFQRAEYEDAVVGNSTWSDGDWSGNGDFDSSDFVLAFQAGGYEKGPRAAIASVPEPASCGLDENDL